MRKYTEAMLKGLFHNSFQRALLVVSWLLVLVFVLPGILVTCGQARLCRAAEAHWAEHGWKLRDMAANGNFSDYAEDEHVDILRVAGAPCMAVLVWRGTSWCCVYIELALAFDDGAFRHYRFQGQEHISPYMDLPEYHNPLSAVLNMADPGSVMNYYGSTPATEQTPEQISLRKKEYAGFRRRLDRVAKNAGYIRIESEN